MNFTGNLIQQKNNSKYEHQNDFSQGSEMLMFWSRIYLIIHLKLFFNEIVLFYKV